MDTGNIEEAVFHLEEGKHPVDVVSKRHIGALKQTRLFSTPNVPF